MKLQKFCICLYRKDHAHEPHQSSASQFYLVVIKHLWIKINYFVETKQKNCHAIFLVHIIMIKKIIICLIKQYKVKAVD